MLAPWELVLELRGPIRSSGRCVRGAACSERAPRCFPGAPEQGWGLAATLQLPQPTLGLQVTKEVCVSQGDSGGWLMLCLPFFLSFFFFCFKPAGLCELRGWLQRKAATQPARDTISYLRVPSRHVLKQAAYLAHSPSLPLLLRHKGIVQVWWNTFSRI